MVEYDESIRKFYVEYEGQINAAKRQCGRLNLQFIDFDSEELVKKRFLNAQNRRKAALRCLGEERIITKELMKRYPDVYMHQNFKDNIEKLVRLKRIV